MPNNPLAARRRQLARQLAPRLAIIFAGVTAMMAAWYYWRRYRYYRHRARRRPRRPYRTRLTRHPSSCLPCSHSQQTILEWKEPTTTSGTQRLERQVRPRGVSPWLLPCMPIRRTFPRSGTCPASARQVRCAHVPRALPRSSAAPSSPARRYVVGKGGWLDRRRFLLRKWILVAQLVTMEVPICHAITDTILETPAKPLRQIFEYPQGQTNISLLNYHLHH
ncbi:hypothetical protein BJY00DRAFT_232854 [Aspergillus carlsbadensis]|nr:hypothetical protein BJY00DRAFT_232854 [Aspergillus carlsbadensis]